MGVVERYIITEFHDDGSLEVREFGPDRFDEAYALILDLQGEDPHRAYWAVEYIG